MQLNPYTLRGGPARRPLHTTSGTALNLLAPVDGPQRSRSFRSSICASRCGVDPEPAGPATITDYQPWRRLGEQSPRCIGGCLPSGAVQPHEFQPIGIEAVTRDGDVDVVDCPDG